MIKHVMFFVFPILLSCNNAKNLNMTVQNQSTIISNLKVINDKTRNIEGDIRGLAAEYSKEIENLKSLKSDAETILSQIDTYYKSISAATSSNDEYNNRRLSVREKKRISADAKSQLSNHVKLKEIYDSEIHFTISLKEFFGGDIEGVETRQRLFIEKIFEWLTDYGFKKIEIQASRDTESSQILQRFTDKIFEKKKKKEVIDVSMTIFYDYMKEDKNTALVKLIM